MSCSFSDAVDHASAEARGWGGEQTVTTALALTQHSAAGGALSAGIFTAIVLSSCVGDHEMRRLMEVPIPTLT